MADDQTKTTDKAPATLQNSIASEVAADAAHYLLRMYPTARPGTHPAMLRSLRAHIANDVQAAMRLGSEAEAREWIARRARHRRELNRLEKLGDQAEEARGDEAAVAAVIEQMFAPQEIDHAG
jgi:hypothetical protein